MQTIWVHQRLPRALLSEDGARPRWGWVNNSATRCNPPKSVRHHERSVCPPERLHRPQGGEIRPPGGAGLGVQHHRFVIGGAGLLERSADRLGSSRIRVGSSRKGWRTNRGAIGIGIVAVVLDLLILLLDASPKLPNETLLGVLPTEWEGFREHLLSAAR